MTSSTTSCRLIACPRILSAEKDRIDVLRPVGGSVADLMRSIGWTPDGLSARVFLDGALVRDAAWEYTVPCAGQALVVRAIPTGGGGQGKDTGRLIAMIGIIALSIAAPALIGATGVLGALIITTPYVAGAITAAVSIVGTLAINALIPPASAKLAQLSGQTAASPSLAGTQNSLAPYAPIPRIYGRIRVYPVYGARPYTEIVGNDQYLRLLFLVGYGPLALSDLKIGETPIESYTDVQVEVRQGHLTDPPVTLYPDAVIEDALSIPITVANGGAIRTSRPNVNELSVDMAFDSGLWKYALPHQVGQEATLVQFMIEYRPFGTTTWLQVDGTVPTAASLTTALTGTNNDLTLTATQVGQVGNNHLVSYVDEGARATEVVRVTPTRDATFHVMVVLRKVGGIYSTAAQVAAALTAATFTQRVVVVDRGRQRTVTLTRNVTEFLTIANAPGNDGTGLVIPLVPTHLSGGIDVIVALSITDLRVTPFRVSRRWTTSSTGQFDVQVTRVTPDRSTDLYVDVARWATLRSIAPGAPITKPGLAQVAMRIKATDQLNGVIDSFNCVAQSILSDWDSPSSSWVLRETSNPASILRDIHQGSANARPKADSRMDLTTMQAFHDRCVAKGFTFNATIDFRTTVKELSRDVVAAGRGTPGLRDGKISVVEDLAQSTPVHVLSPRNSWGFRGTKRFVDLPHALKVRFIDPLTLQQDERFVYADGYNASGSDGLTAATIFETVDAGLGVTDPDQIYKLKRYDLAVLALRPETYELSTDFENLIMTRGDLIRVVHDVPLFGLGSARVRTVTIDGGGNATAVTIDDVLTMTTGTQYGARFRRSDSVQVVALLTTVAGDQSTLTFVTAIPAASVPASGDLVVLGVYGQESVEMLVKSIAPGQDFTAHLTLLDYAPGVQLADSGTIPPFVSQITQPSVRQDAIPSPLIEQVRSDESVMLRSTDGSLVPRIVISVHFSSGAAAPVAYLEVQHRFTAGDSPWVRQVLTELNGSMEVVIDDVVEGLTYDVRIRSVGALGQSSEWNTISAHAVIGKTSAPPDVSGLTLNSPQLVWVYATPPTDLAGFRVRVQVGDRPSWGDAIPLHDALVSQTTFVLFRDSGVRTYLVKAVDTSGNESLSPATLLVDYGAIVTANVAEIVDLKALGFPGTITNGSLSGGNLAADSDTLFWKTDGQPFWTFDNALFWPGTYQSMQYVATITPASDWLGGTLVLDLHVTAGGWMLEFRPDSATPVWANDLSGFWSTDGTLFWSGSVGEYLSWPGQLTGYTRQDYQFRLTTNAGNIQGLVDFDQAIFDMPDIDEVLLNVALDSVGTRLPLTKSYRVITVVAPTLVEDGGTARRIKVLDKELIGPLVQGVDASDIGVTAHSDFVVQGY